MAKLEKADFLERAIVHLDTLFEQDKKLILPPEIGVPLGFGSDDEVTDTEYDTMRYDLKILRPKSKALEGLTASTIVTNTPKVKHVPPMTSIQKASHEDQAIKEGMFFDWLAKVTNGASSKHKLVTIPNKTYKGNPVQYPEDYLYQSWKLDGSGVGIYYVDGKYTRAGLRPRKGRDGEDVTEQMKHVSGVPMKLSKPITCSFRGEIICFVHDFEKVCKEKVTAGEDLPSNPRSHSTSIQNEPHKIEALRLSFVAHGLEGVSNPQYKTEFEKQNFSESLGVKFVSVKPFKWEETAKMEAQWKKLPFEVDGTIIGINSLEEQEQMGRSGDPKWGNPNGKIAWKFAEEKAEAKITSIDWNVNRYGITPVANFEPVRLADTNVRRATMHNIGFMMREHIDVGTTVVILKAGKIIPKCVGVAFGACKGMPDFPKKCPSCGGDTEVTEGGVGMFELTCSNPDCSSKNVSQLIHFLETFGVLGVGESTVTKLVETGLVKRPADFLALTTSKAVKGGLSMRQAMLAVANIHLVHEPEKLDDVMLAVAIKKISDAKIKMDLWRLLAALGIDNLGKTTSKDLVDHFRTLEAIWQATPQQLLEVNNIGEKTALAVHETLKKRGDDLWALLNHVEPLLPTTGKLTGKSFCITGNHPDHERTWWEKKIEDLGGKCSGSVGRKTDFLVVGAEPGDSKIAKANQLGTKQISFSELEKML